MQALLHADQLRQPLHGGTLGQFLVSRLQLQLLRRSDLQRALEKRQHLPGRLLAASGTSPSEPVGNDRHNDASSFTWNASAGATYYLLRVTDSTGLVTDTWWTPPQVGCATGTGVCVRPTTTALPAGASSWTVLSAEPDRSPYSEWSATIPFLIDLTPPDLSTIASSSLRSNGATVTWTTSELAGQPDRIRRHHGVPQLDDFGHHARDQSQ